MSGHSKWSTIKRQKEVKDISRGKLFSKLSRAISIAVKTGGGGDPATNNKLRVAVDAAKTANMPKSNIERAINKASTMGNLEELTYEGFGPEGINVVVEVATDNRNRTGQDVKGLFERAGGRLAGPGAVMFNFDSKGMILIKKQAKAEEQMLDLIDLGVEDVEETEDGIEAYTNPEDLGSAKSRLKESGYEIISVDLVRKPISLQLVNNVKTADKTLKLLSNLSKLDDVQKVFSNFDLEDTISEEVLKE